MKYITGLFALNIHQDSETCGDWHSNILDTLEYSNTDDLYGCKHYDNIELPNGTVLADVWVANHYRALADRFISHLNSNPNLLLHEVDDFLDSDKDKFTEYLVHFNLQPKTEDAFRLLIHEIGLTNTTKLQAKR